MKMKIQNYLVGVVVATIGWFDQADADNGVKSATVAAIGMFDDNTVSNGQPKRRRAKSDKKTARPLPVTPPVSPPVSPPTPMEVPPRPVQPPKSITVDIYDDEAKESFNQKLNKFFANNRDQITRINQGSDPSAVDTGETGEGRASPRASSPYVPLSITHIPLEETTGVSVSMFQLAATVSQAAYDFSGMEEFVSDAFNFEEGYPADLPQPEVIFSTDNGMLKDTQCPFVMVVVGQTLILGWRGSYTPVDFMRDASFYLSSSSRWSELSKVVKVHGGFLSQVEDHLVEYEKYILQVIEGQNINRILTTGHSLGGAIAQVANLWLQGSMSDSSVNAGITHPKWAELKARPDGLSVRTISFEGPSTTLYLPSDDLELNQKGLNFLTMCGVTMINTCFQNDIVPRLLGNPLWVLNSLTEIFSTMRDDARYIGVNRYVLGYVITFLQALINIEQHPLLTVASMYNFIGKTIYYSGHDELPVVCVDDRDYGYTYPTGEGESYPQFKSVDYNPNSANPTDTLDLYYDHVFPVRGPGFGISFKPAFCLSFGSNDGSCVNCTEDGEGCENGEECCSDQCDVGFGIFAATCAP